MDRNARNVLHQRGKGIGRRARATEAVEFFNVLTSPALLETTEALLPEHRERLYPPTVALSMFMRQALEADGSCQKATNTCRAMVKFLGNIVSFCTSKCRKCNDESASCLEP